MNEFNPQTGFHSYYVYIITNKYRSTYYIGMTNNLKERLSQHKENLELGNKTFASKYLFPVEISKITFSLPLTNSKFSFVRLFFLDTQLTKTTNTIKTEKIDKAIF